MKSIFLKSVINVSLMKHLNNSLYEVTIVSTVIVDSSLPK